MSVAVSMTFRHAGKVLTILTAYENIDVPVLMIRFYVSMKVVVFQITVLHGAYLH